MSETNLKERLLQRKKTEAAARDASAEASGQPGVAPAASKGKATPFEAAVDSGAIYARWNRSGEQTA